jgi:hypothetical protein
MPSDAARHVELPPGATAAAFNGSLAADKDAEFVVAEDKGVHMFVQVIGQDDDPFVSVHRTDTGADLPDEHKANVAHWIAELPEAMGYLIVVHKTGKPTPFSLILEVPRELMFDDPAKPTEASISLPANGEAAYLIPPSTSITAELTGGPSDAYMTLNTMDDGKPMLKAEAKGRQFSGAPGNTKDTIVLRVHQGSQAGDLKLKVQRQ